MLLAGLAIAALLAAFWFLVLTPKRDQAADLQTQIESLEASVAEQEQLAAAAEQAKGTYAENYHRLVVLGKAVPGDDDTSSLFVELQESAQGTGVELDVIELTPGTVAAPAAPAAQTTTDQAAAEGTPTAGSETATAAPATEASAAMLPLGASVGPAGLPVMPYKLSLRGDFFELAAFMDRLDELVGIREGEPFVHGRLITTDSFELGPDEEKGFPDLTATLNLTTFVTPADQGLTAGATPAAPAPTSPAPAPVSETAAPTPAP
jgi:Tfp pilus assembly protein PilO